MAAVPMDVDAVLRSLRVAVSWMTRDVSPKPVPAGCYGLRVRRGRDWEWDDQDVGGLGVDDPT